MTGERGHKAKFGQRDHGIKKKITSSVTQQDDCGSQQRHPTIERAGSKPKGKLITWKC